ncbi:TetR/AcrR family transcriptional regulator [Phreatobacter stygius]|uniref:TetR/AcrR family transcriptional regulator n=1 Tax=Phreatobacter stygius TaxID=1940610 RepID=A0A4D7AYT4_9HYPH|nr:TetR/AcrR family transcriptional regulator [Phreatobacter stygius]QCI65461.1 TetR/AcrR family transcriptional regulator [Phreatobacter stygius]
MSVTAPEIAASDIVPLDRREEVLAAAAECFMRRGYEQTSMDDVAEALGATKGRVYHHFRSKPELFFQVYRRAMDILMQACEPVVAQGGSGEQRLHGMAKAHTLCMMETRTFQRTLTMGVDLYRFGETSPEHKAVLEELMGLRFVYEDLFRHTFEAGIADGTLAVPDPSLAMRTLLGALNWVTVWYSPRPGETRRHREQLAEEIVETVLGGYRARR